MLAGKGIRVLAATAVVVFAMWFRLEYLASTIDYIEKGADAGQYRRIASNLIEHGIYSMSMPDATNILPDSYRSPGYPLLVAVTMVLAGDQHWRLFLLFVQAVLGALSVALTIAIACRWLPFAYAITAGLLVAVWPHMVTLTSNILTETLFGFTLLLSIYLLCKAQSSGQRVWYVLAGFSFAYAALTNPAILPFPLLIGAFLLFSKRQHALLFIVCTLLLPMAWGARGLMLDSDRSSGSRLMENVLVGMDPEFNLTDTPEAVASRTRFHADMESFKNGQFGGLETIVKRLAEDPAMYAKWYLIQKPMRLWQWSMVMGTEDIYVYPVLTPAFKIVPFFRLVASVCYSLNLWLFAAALCSLVVLAARCARGRLEGKDTPWLMVALLFLYATALHMVLTPDARYAAPYRPFEIMLAVSLVAMVHQTWRAQKDERELQVT